MKKFLKLVLSSLMLISMVGCSNSDLDVATGQKEEEINEETETTVDLDNLDYSESLKINLAQGNNSRTITYQQATPLELPDGSVVSQGDLKPTWQYFQDQIGIELDDVTVQDQKATEMIDLAAATVFTDANIYGGNGIAEKLMSYGANGYFVNLLDYLDQMPNFKAYLDENPNIVKSISGVYFAPYVAEIDNYARILHGRETWFHALLDSTDSLLDETSTLTPVYDGYWDRNTENVIALQNAAAEANGGELTRDLALTTLVDYINATYPDLENPSDLYLGSNAQYDMDELVALWRVAKLSPNTLSTLEAGSTVDGAIIYPYFVRKSKYREDFLRLITYFGGERVYGSDSYGAKFFLDENGELQYSYDQDNFLEGVDQLKDIFAEGLVHSEFADLSNSDDFRKTFYAKDEEEGHLQFGFMTDDWIASTTASNEDVVGVLPPVTTIEGYTDDFIHFVENTRVIKPDGWSISTSSTDAEINSALKLFDYMYTEEGHQAQIYSIPEAVSSTEKFESAGVEYPKFNDWLLEQAGIYKSGDVSSFLRDFMGSLIPLGYQKEIGFEKQYTTENGEAAWDLYEGSNVLSTSYSADSTLLQLVPPVFSLNEQDLAKLSTIAIGDTEVDDVFLYITGSDNALESTDAIKQKLLDSGIEDYVQIYRTAYQRMTSE